MLGKRIKLVNILLIVLIVCSATIAFSQFEPNTQPDQPTEQQLPPPAKNSIFQQVPPSYWIRIDAFKTFSIIVVLLAFILGFVSYFIGLNAGGRENKSQIRRSIISTMVIAMVARPVFILGHQLLGRSLAYMLSESVAYGIAGLIIYFIWTLYIVAIPVYLYESFTVSAKEAYPAGGRH